MPRPLILLVLGFLSGASAWADGHGELLGNLILLARPNLHVLTREIHTFNYAPEYGAPQYYEPDDTKIVAGINAGIRKHHQDRAYLHPVSNSKTWFGMGFYAAIEPQVSRNYGDPNFFTTSKADFSHPWILRRVTLASGSRLLDLAGRGMALSKELVSLLQNEDCNVSDDPQLKALFVTRNPGRQRCRLITNELVMRLGVSAFLYAWGGAGKLPPSCKGMPVRAFVLTAPLPEGSVRTFSQVLPERGDAADQERVAIESLFRYMRRPEMPKALWPALTPLDQAATDQYAKDHLFGCGGLPEEKLPWAQQ